MLRECTFHLPVTLNDGGDATQYVDECISEIIDKFGGCTVQDAQGYWKDDGVLYQEAVKRITVSSEWGWEVLAIASKYAQMMHQLALYFIHPNGEVEIITLPDGFKEAA